MNIEEKIEALKKVGYPTDEFTITQINRQYERVIGMGIKDIRNVGLHPHANEN